MKEKDLLIWVTVLVLSAVFFMLPAAAAAEDAAAKDVTGLESRRKEMKRLKRLLPPCPEFEEWLKASGELPPDFNEILACVAPRPTLVIVPTHDRHANYAHVAEAIKQAKKAYKLLDAEEAIELQSPDDWNRLTDAMQTTAIQWLKRQAEKER